MKILEWQVCPGFGFIPALEIDGKRRWFMSRRNPQREAQRLGDGAKDSGLIILVGWDAGLTGHELAKNCTCPILLVDPYPELSQEIAQRNGIIPPQNSSDYTWYGTATDSDELLGILEQFYHPLFISELSIITLPVFENTEDSRCSQIKSLIHQYIHQINNDATIQAGFGNRWLENSLANLWALNSQNFNFFEQLSTKESAYLFGAGPSLDGFDSGINPEQLKNSLVVCVDTALPFLSARNISPDIVLCLDAQWYSIDHLRLAREFMNQKDSHWILDFAVSPLLLRNLHQDRIPFSFRFSNHPFNQLLSSFDYPMNSFNFTSTNAGLAGIEFAHQCGIQDINYLGLDFSFPQFHSYAHGTYRDIYDEVNRTRLVSRDSFDIGLMKRTGELIFDSKIDGFLSGGLEILQNTRDELLVRRVDSLDPSPKEFNWPPPNQIAHNIVTLIEPPITSLDTLRTQLPYRILIPGVLGQIRRRKARDSLDILRCAQEVHQKTIGQLKLLAYNKVL